MKILLIAMNAKYIHSNLAVYSLRAFAKEYAEHIKIIELTINHTEEDILKMIYREKADVAAFSCYIWNIDMIARISKELKKVQSKIKVWYGGPEVSYDYKSRLKEYDFLDGIMLGEGEQTFLDLMNYYIGGLSELMNIPGLAFKESARREGVAGKEVMVTSTRQPLELDVIPFPYQDIEAFQNRILYYESSRGCPFSCSYCLSSIDRGVRLRSFVLVQKELKLFLDYKIPQVKFVDRTFNCNRKHAMDIWSFIKENDNGITNFHFEISADLLTEEELDFLSTLRPGQVQFEIGVQSTNPDTIKAIHRKMDFKKLSANSVRLKEGRNIHQHLDLIAGLPLDDIASFEQSFQEVYHLKPDQLQLGFLKILKGSLMEEDSIKYGIKYWDTAPYEVLSTANLSYDEVLQLKGICEMVEVYYNSAQFIYSIGFLEHYFVSPMKLYQSLSEYYETRDISMMAHSRLKRFEILFDFFEEIILKEISDEEKPELLHLYKEILIFDLLLREGIKTRPSFAPEKPLRQGLRELYQRYQKDRRLIHIEQFTYDVVLSSQQGRAVKKNFTILFDYSERDPLNNSAKLTELT